MLGRILIVEDHADNRKLLEWILEEESYDLQFVESGEDALAAVAKEKFDLVLMDIGLPGISGEEATRQIREQEQFASLPIVALTAHALTSEVERIRAAGFNDLVTKPIDEEELLEVMKRYFSSCSKESLS